MLHIYLVCYKCKADKVPFHECMYLKNDKSIWINKIRNQIEKLLKGYFLSTMAQKLNINFRFYGDDLDRVLDYCSQMNSEVEISGFSRKMRNFFADGGRLNSEYMKKIAKMFRQTIQLYLVRVEHPSEWYFLYKHPDGEPGFASKGFHFALRDKNLQTLFLNSSKNSSFEIDQTSSLLLTRIAYSASNMKPIDFHHKNFLYNAFEQTFKDFENPPNKSINSKILFRNYLAKGEKDAKKRIIDVDEDKDTIINQILRFEENSYKTFEKIREQLSKINFLTVVNKFFKMLSLELQFMIPQPNEQVIIDMLKDDLKFVFNEEKIEINLPKYDETFNAMDCLEERILKKEYFNKVNIKTSKRQGVKKSALYKLVKYKELELEQKMKDQFLYLRKRKSSSMSLSNS